jgi:hypothetical protein
MNKVRNIGIEAGAGAYLVRMEIGAGGTVYVSVIRGLDIIMGSSGKSVDEAAGKLVEALREIEEALGDVVKVARRLEDRPAQGVV